MIKVTLFGYGQMGKIIKDLAPEQDLEIVSVYDPPLGLPLQETQIMSSDVIIDFSLPETVLANLELAVRLGRNIVIGTTGWHDKLKDAVELVDSSGLGLVYGSNFSLGMNLFMEILSSACKLIDKVPEYDIFGHEAHHNRKVDSPSGTARTLSSIILSRIERKDRVLFDRIERKIESSEFQFASIRSGSLPGSHTVGFDSPADTIELKHRARNRMGFALGAIRAARWITGKKGCFDFRDVFREILNS